MALTDILARIEKDTDEEVFCIIDEAKRDAAWRIDQARAKADSRREEIAAAAELDAERDRETTLANARLHARDLAVEARHELARRVLRRAEEALAALPKDRYAALLAERVASVARGGETLRVAAADAERLDDVSDALAAAAEAADITLDLSIEDDPAGLPHGILLEGDRMSIEVSPRSFITERREELLALAADALFGDEG